MKRNVRMLNVIKRFAAVATVLLLLVWVGSAWFNGGLKKYPWRQVTIRPQHVCIEWYDFRTPAYPATAKWTPFFYRCDDIVNPSAWWPGYDRSTYVSGGGVTTATKVRIPFWIIALLSATVMCLIIRGDRKRAIAAKLNPCPNCGYSLLGLPKDRACPECGAPQPAA